MSDRNKRIVSILTIFTIIFTVMGGSLAYWNWSSSEASRTGVAFTIDKDFSCSADGGQNINSTNIELQPTSDCTNSNYALQRTIKVTPDIKRDNLTIYMNMWLKVNSLGTPLSESENLMYAISTTPGSCKKEMEGYVTGGNFKGLTTNDKVNLLNGKEYTGMNLPQDTYYLYIWLDAVETNNNTQNQSFDFSLGGECSDNLTKTLSETIMSLSNEENSGVSKESAIAMQEGNWEIINANENSWSSMSLDSGFTTSGDRYVLISDCSEEEGEDGSVIPAYCDSKTATATFRPLNDGKYRIQVDSPSYDGGSYIDVVTFSVSIDNQLMYENHDSGMVELGFLTPENDIKVIVSNPYSEGSTYYESSFKFSKVDATGSTIDTYRYQGKNVNNYLIFNNETWRIIGVEEGSLIGLEKDKYYPKIIRSESVTNIPYDNCRQGWGYSWNEVMLYELLNGGYYNKFAYYEYCNDADLDYGFTTNGLTSASRQLIENPKWIGLQLSDIETTKETYSKEMQRNASGYIGLMSPSDYGYAANQDICADTELTSYASCSSNNWLFTGKNEWLISSDNDENYEFLGVNPEGNVTSFSSLDNIGYRPVVYLDSNVKVTGGSGAIGDEYEIELVE